MGNLGIGEMIVIGLIAVLLFGTKRLPELGSGLGKAIKDFKSALHDTTPDPGDSPEKGRGPAAAGEDKPQALKP